MFAVASRATKSGDVILKVVNAAGEAHTTQIDLAGLEGKVTVGHGERVDLGLARGREHD